MRFIFAVTLWAALAAGTMAQPPTRSGAPSPEPVTFNRDIAPIFGHLSDLAGGGSG